MSKELDSSCIGNLSLPKIQRTKLSNICHSILAVSRTLGDGSALLLMQTQEERRNLEHLIRNNLVIAVLNNNSLSALGSKDTLYLRSPKGQQCMLC